MTEEKYYKICLEQKSYEGTLLFWKPRGAGYTSDLNKAGLYDKKTATETNKIGRDIALTMLELEACESFEKKTLVDCLMAHLESVKESMKMKEAE